jgi:hypothetical protein
MYILQNTLQSSEDTFNILHYKPVMPLALKDLL